MDIIFNVDEQTITAQNETGNPVTGSKNVLKAKFNFTGTIWEGIVKVAVFKNERGQEFNKFLGRGSYGECIIPAAVLYGDYFTVSCYGGDLVVTTELIVALTPGGYNRRRCEGQDIFIDIYEALDDKVDNTEYNNDLTEVHEILDTKFNTNDFIDCFDSRAELWMQDVIDAINAS